jgi:hypothetical protein
MLIHKDDPAAKRRSSIIKGEPSRRPDGRLTAPYANEVIAFVEKNGLCVSQRGDDNVTYVVSLTPNDTQRVIKALVGANLVPDLPKQLPPQYKVMPAPAKPVAAAAPVAQPAKTPQHPSKAARPALLPRRPRPEHTLPKKE